MFFLVKKYKYLFLKTFLTFVKIFVVENLLFTWPVSKLCCQNLSTNFPQTGSLRVSCINTDSINIWFRFKFFMTTATTAFSSYILTNEIICFVFQLRVTLFKASIVVQPPVAWLRSSYACAPADQRLLIVSLR